MSNPRSAKRIAPALRTLVPTLTAVALLTACTPHAAAQLREVGRGRVAGQWNVAYDVDVEGGYAFVTGNLGVNVFDVRDPAHPRVVGAVPDGGAASGIAVCDGVAYLSDGNGWLRVINVRNTVLPQLLSRIRVGERGHGIGCAAGLVYYADPRAGLHVVDVGDPAAPRRLATVPGTGTAWDMQLREGRLYLGRHGEGVSVLDLADPRAPQVLGTLSDGGEAYGVSGDSTRIFVADLQQGVELLDVSEPSNIRLAARLQGYAPHSVCLSGTHVYLADQDKGLVVFTAAP